MQFDNDFLSKKLLPPWSSWIVSPDIAKSINELTNRFDTFDNKVKIRLLISLIGIYYVATLYFHHS